ncbi:MAG: methyltransferase domain-containing protein [Pseudomonadota bacterium]
MTQFTAAEITQDAFLGGRLTLSQPKQGYRAGVDAVLLSACINAISGERVLELGCGAGAAILCLGQRIEGLSLTGVERDPAYAALARRNGVGRLKVVEADITALPLDLRQRQFDHVLANPPYFDRGASISSQDLLREAAHAENTPLAEWVGTAAKRLAPKGLMHFIHLTERLPEILAALPSGMGSIEVLPLAARQGRRPDRMILRARKNGRAAFRLHAARILHSGSTHQSDADDYTPEIAAALRAGSPLYF